MSEQSAAIITGASRGIGRSIALALAADGVPVGLIARDAERLEEVVGEILATGGTAVYRVADVTDAAAVSRAVGELAAALGTPIRLLVNNAGRIDREVALWEADAAEWRDIVETNLIGTFNTSRAVVPLMLAAGGGRVIEITSGAGAKDWSKASAYTASKAAMIRNVGHLHEAGFGLGLRSFAIAPGTVKTDMSTSMELHAGRAEFTPVALTTSLISAINDGALDNWSGKYLRVTHDSASSLLAYEAVHGAPPPEVRRLAIIPWGEDDPQVVEALVPKRG